MFISPLSETQVKVCTLSVNQCVLGREALSMFLQQTSDLTPLQTRRYTHTSLCVCVQAKQICTDVYLKRVSLHCQPVSEIRERADLGLMREEGKKGLHIETECRSELRYISEGPDGHQRFWLCSYEEVTQPVRLLSLLLYSVQSNHHVSSLMPLQFVTIGWRLFCLCVCISQHRELTWSGLIVLFGLNPDRICIYVADRAFFKHQIKTQKLTQGNRKSWKLRLKDYKLWHFCHFASAGLWPL